MDDEQLLTDLSSRLREAHRRLAALPVSETEKAYLAGRVIVISDAAKHDLRRASVRLDRLLEELRARENP